MNLENEITTGGVDEAINEFEQTKLFWLYITCGALLLNLFIIAGLVHSINLVRKLRKYIY